MTSWFATDGVYRGRKGGTGLRIAAALTLLISSIAVAGGKGPTTAGPASQAAPAAAPNPPAAFAAKGFQVLSHERDMKSGLHIWLVQHPSAGKTVLYSTPDNTVFFTGPMWDGASGSNVSDRWYALIDVSAQPTQTQPAPQGTASSTGGVPESIVRLSKLKGIKDGAKDAPPNKTLYVFFDPRCPYCKQFYEATRARADMKGKAIVWLPMSILANKPAGAMQVAEIMQAKNPQQAMQLAFSGLLTNKVSATEATTALIRENESIFFAAFQANPSAGSAAVPVAFFVDRAGHPQMVPNPIVHLNKIFAEMM